MIILDQNLAQMVTFVLVDANCDEVAGLGATWAAQISKAGGALSASTGTKAEIGSGWYAYTFTAAETNTIGPLSLQVTHASIETQNVMYFVRSAAVGVEEVIYELLSSLDGTPIDAANVWVTDDAGGANIIASGVTDASGLVTFWLPVGTYYVWRQKVGWNFTNPDVETVT